MGNGLFCPYIRSLRSHTSIPFIGVILLKICKIWKSWKSVKRKYNVHSCLLFFPPTNPTALAKCPYMSRSGDGVQVSSVGQSPETGILFLEYVLCWQSLSRNSVDTSLVAGVFVSLAFYLQGVSIIRIVFTGVALYWIHNSPAIQSPVWALLAWVLSCMVCSAGVFRIR